MLGFFGCRWLEVPAPKRRGDLRCGGGERSDATSLTLAADLSKYLLRPRPISYAARTQRREL